MPNIVNGIFQEFLATLDQVVKDKILVNLLRMGRGRLDFAKELASEHYRIQNHPHKIHQSGASVKDAAQCLMGRKIFAAKGLHASPATLFF